MNVSELLPYDKALHLIAGFVIFTILHFIGPLIALAVVFLAAASKEAYDYLSGKGTPDKFDALA